MTKINKTPTQTTKKFYYTLLSNLELIDKVIVVGNEDGISVLNIQKDGNTLLPDPSWNFVDEKELEKVCIQKHVYYHGCFFNDR
jgi:hypothetical protein